MELKWIKPGKGVTWEEKARSVLLMQSSEVTSSNPIIDELRSNHNFMHMYPILVNRDNGDTLELSFIGNLKILHIDFIGVTEQKKGRGSYYMRVLTHLADKYDMTLQLEICPRFGVQKRVLKRFYTRYGFVKKRGTRNSYERVPKIDRTKLIDFLKDF